MSQDVASNPTLLVVGPLAREQYGELMGLPQVAAQPDAVAAHVASCLNSGTFLVPPARSNGQTNSHSQ